ncbi:unnamed protein product [Didymodactylos carnosus]|uniref:Uncharacterized protein n=1 Tax=Didymodactylos carnosus TaxID=1234261 RepID=A0A8S2F4V2_9BILA|nr:unnamed protein product [Didymodactylos carnosus]CAF4152078.1 unnamed protein product [Didymodactylos carnosus]
MIYVDDFNNEQDIEHQITTMKVEVEIATTNIDLLNSLWKKTFSYRRLFVRPHTTDELVQKFPGYTYPCLIFEEVKMTDDIDVEQNVNEILPSLFEKLPNNILFLSGAENFDPYPPLSLTSLININQELHDLSSGSSEKSEAATSTEAVQDPSSSITTNNESTLLEDIISFDPVLTTEQRRKRRLVSTPKERQSSLRLAAKRSRQGQSSLRL